MASDLNKVILIGRLTADPEMRTTPTGTQVGSFSVANNRTYNANGERKEQVSFFNCVAWAKTAEIISTYVKKGQRIGIEGRLQQRSWEDKDGNKRSVVEINVENFQFLSPPKEGNNGQTVLSGGTDVTGNVENPFTDSDIPF